MVAKAKFRLEGEDATGTAFKSALGQAQSTASKMKGVFSAAFAGISLAGITSIARNITMGDELQKAAIKAGIGGRAISELAYAAKLADVDLGSLSNSLRFMQKVISEAGSGSKSARASFEALGLSFTEIRKLAPDKQFELIGDRISQLKDPADRARAAVEFFSRAGADMLPLFEQGAAGIRKAREEAVKLGHSFSDEQLKALGDADDAVKRLRSSFDAFAAVLVAKVAPALTSFFNQLAGLDSERATLERSIRLLDSFVVKAKLGPEEQAKAIAHLRQRLEQLDALERGIEARRAGAGRRGRNVTIETGDTPPGFVPPAVLEELSPTVFRRFDRDRALRGFAPVVIEAEELVKVRWDDFSQSILENTEHIGDGMEKVFENHFEGIVAQAEEASRGIFEGLRNFFLDPFEDGLRGLGRSVGEVFQNIFANVAALKTQMLIFGEMDKKGNFSGGLLSSFLNNIFGAFGSRDSGGRGRPGEPVWIGKGAQPELFVPDSAGTFIPRGAMGGLTLHVAPVIHIDSRADAAFVRSEVARGVRIGVEASVGKVRDLKARGRL